MKKIILLSILIGVLSAGNVYTCTPYKKKFEKRTYLYKERSKIKFSEDMNGTFLTQGTNVYELVDRSKGVVTYEDESYMIIIPSDAKENFIEISKAPISSRKKIYTTYFCFKGEK